MLLCRTPNLLFDAVIYSDDGTALYGGRPDHIKPVSQLCVANYIQSTVIALTGFEGWSSRTDKYRELGPADGIRPWRNSAEGGTWLDCMKAGEDPNVGRRAR